MPSGGGALACPHETQAETEVRVVVHRIDLQRASELLARLVEPTAPVVRPPERFADRALVRLQRTRPLEHDRGRVRVLALEKPQALGVRVVCVLAHRAVLESRVRQSAANTRCSNGVVPEFIPFPGLRYASASDLARLVAPPYDVIDEAERERLEQLDPHNSVRLVLPRAEHGHDPYEVAADRLTEWCRTGVLTRDPAPTLTIVRMCRSVRGAEHTTVGVIGALRLPDGTNRGILPHERTLPKAKSDRLALLRATRANLDPIWGLSLASGLSALLAIDRPASTVCIDETGTRHETWTVTDPPHVTAIADRVGSTAVVLADGHHRFETAQTYRAERIGHDDPGADAVMAFVVELAPDQLSIEPIHRVVRLRPHSDVRALLHDAFEVVDPGPNTSEAVESFVAQAADRDAIGLVDHRGRAFLVPRPATRRTVAASWPGPVAETDAALIEAAVRPALPEADWEYQPDADQVARLVRSGGADAAFLLRPVGVAQTRAVAEAGLRMPQKTTFFAPKPRTGLVFRTLD